MTSDRLRRVVNARPFRSFRICISNGHEHIVRHPEMVAILSRDDTVFFYHDDGAISVLDLLLVPEIKVDAIRTAQTN